MRTIIFSFLLSVTLGGVYCQQPQVGAKSMTASEAADFVAKHKTVQILDVRTPEEWGSGTIKGARKLNFLDADFAEKAVAQLDKEKPVLVYCAVGGRSSKAAGILQKLGFKEVINMSQGFGAWKDGGHPVE